MAIAPGLVAG